MGKRCGPERLQLGGLNFGPSEVRPGLPVSHLQTQRHVPPWDLTEDPHLTEAALPLPVLLGFLLKLL